VEWRCRGNSKCKSNAKRAIQQTQQFECTVCVMSFYWYNLVPYPSINRTYIHSKDTKGPGQKVLQSFSTIHHNQYVIVEATVRSIYLHVPLEPDPTGRKILPTSNHPRPDGGAMVLSLVVLKGICWLADWIYHPVGFGAPVPEG